MVIYDISLPLRSAHPPWPEDVPFSRELAQSMKEGDSCNVSTLRLSAHFATHMDAPFHFIDDGATMEQLDLSTLMGPALVHEVPDADKVIEPRHLPDLTGVDRIIFKTANTRFIADTEFHTQFVSLGLEAARVLTQAGVKLVGIDYFSIEAFAAVGHPVHKELLGRGVVILEGADLRLVTPGWYELITLPLKIEGADGSPCRAILRTIGGV